MIDTIYMIEWRWNPEYMAAHPHEDLIPGWKVVNDHYFTEKEAKETIGVRSLKHLNYDPGPDLRKRDWRISAWKRQEDRDGE